MVKKILSDGSPCPKCAQAEDILKKRRLWNKINRVIIADEADPSSRGMQLAEEHAVKLAPFFIVEDEAGERIYTGVLNFIKKELNTIDSENSERNPSRTPFPADLQELNTRFENLDPREVLDEAQKTFGSGLALAFSGAEDVVLIEMAQQNGRDFSVFCLDTGRLHPETYEFIDSVRDHYGIAIDIFTPSPQLLEPFVREKGMNSFYREGHHECCGIRKVEPLKRALKGRRAWATGLRRDQSPATRSDMSVAAWDGNHLSTEGESLLKINPLLHWSSDQVWAYIRENEVPYNPLHDAGYRSIGCSPCTRPSRPAEHERMSRWWWEDSTRRECGLHVGDLGESKVN